MGRNREFDIDEALDAALQVFWRKGYDGASLPELTAAMGINRPSLYAAFGNKEALFCKALARYREGPAAYVREAVATPTAREMFERLLHGAVDLMTDPKNPRGCLIVQGGLTCAGDSDRIRVETAQMRETAMAAIQKRLSTAKADGELTARAVPRDMARYVMTMINGLSIQAGAGATRAQLRRVADVALVGLGAFLSSR